MEIKQTIYGKVPSKSNSYKLGKAGGYDRGHCLMMKTKALKEYENSFFMQLHPKFRNLNISEYFEFHAFVFYPSNRSDLDNFLKIVLDCLQKAKVIKNDNRCVKIIAEKAIDKENPRLEFEIKIAK